MNTPTCQSCSNKLYDAVEIAYGICRGCYQELKNESLFYLENADLTGGELDQAEARHNELYETPDWNDTKR